MTQTVFMRRLAGALVVSVMFGCGGNAAVEQDSGAQDSNVRDTGVADQGTTDNGTSLLAAGAACTAGALCASGFCVDQVCCATACQGTCMACSMAKTGQANGTCAAVSESTDPDTECDGPCLTGTCGGGQCTARANGTVCRASVAACDAAEVCASGVCPADQMQTAGFVCRAAAGACDVAETCDGTANTCDADGVAASSANVPACAPYACPGVGTSCRTTCVANTDCARGYVCVTGNTNSCVRGRRIFVTSSMHTGNLGGLAGADAICQTRASAAGLTGTFRAWLSDSTTDAASRIDHYDGPYYRVDSGEDANVYTLARNWADLSSGLDLYAIATTETGASSLSGTYAWTGTATSGAASGTNCSNWTSADSNQSGQRGWTSAGGPDWSSYTPAMCDSTHRLYCVETN